MADVSKRRKQGRTQHQRVPVQEAREHFKEYLNLVEFRNQRVIITRYGKDAAALVSIADLEKLEGAA